MQITQHEFTRSIIEILDTFFPGQGEKVLQSSELLQYLNIKTRAANRGSKSRAGLANHYAIYVLVEDYLNNQFHLRGSYEDYEGAQFTLLLQRQRMLPFGSKLQNHALNHRLNEEFRKYFHTSLHAPILRDARTNRYWINENLLKIWVGSNQLNIGESIKAIIDAYVEARSHSFNEFMVYCREMINIQQQSPERVVEFIRNLLKPNIDARIFEIVSYAVLKEHYAGQQIYWGWSIDELNAESLTLYKTGRTNANDGGIDFVMKPLGRFFQVTETIDAGKYFLDIDKVQKFPITFVVKTEKSTQEILEEIQTQATARYKIRTIVQQYMELIDQVINIPDLMRYFNLVLERNRITSVIEEIVLQSRVEFNVEVEEQDLLTDQEAVEN